MGPYRQILYYPSSPVQLACARLNKSGKRNTPHCSAAPNRPLENKHSLETDIDVDEFAHLALVDANNLALLRHLHPHAWDIVHDLEYGGLNRVRIAPKSDKGKLTVTTNE